VSCAKTAEPVDLPFGLWTRVGRRKHKFNRIHQVAPMRPHGRAHWRHLANTIEPPICCGDAVLSTNIRVSKHSTGCQTGWTTCCMFIRRERLGVRLHEPNKLNS